uniref:Kinase non-catalytic C-lobe domain containing 1 n=1 Tax=Cyprinus carpio TaxID=7962 RepID=A0A8C2K2D0_CYPCA
MCSHPQENVSLADILCLREGGLSEQELWAVCVECVCSLQSIGLSPLFHTLCVTPDTLAFNTHGNVCFMEQLNDDPDGCFVPPEFDKTGSTFEGHMFSLGSTLWAALDSVSEAELQVELSEESRCLLKQMQREKPEDRPRLQDIVSQAEAVLGDVSPAVICRKLSAIGRRVLSIESVAALQGVSSQLCHNAAHLMLCEGITRLFELWALCYMCLSTLQTYIDLPGQSCTSKILCFVFIYSVILFILSFSASCDAFFLAPEFQEHGIVTEKACVYGVAAVLWATAKFNLSPNQKLAMPRKLKRLLLEMAKRTPIERPSIEMAKKVCLCLLISGFVPLASEGRLEPVAGPVPHHYPESSTSVRLPEAFTSPATHFSPIILTHHPQSDAAEDDGTSGVFSASYSSSSSSKTLVNSSPPATLQITNQETDNQPNVPALSCVNGICNNFLLQQDPQTGRLTLLPVQIAVLQPITGTDHFSSESPNKKPPKPSEDSVRIESVCVTHRDSAVSPESPVTDIIVQPNSAPHCLNLSRSHSRQRGLCLQHVTELLREEFAFDGHLENRVQDLAMGKYIFSLKTLQFETFCRAITEKFSDLHWDQKLLCDLHRLINQHSFCEHLSLSVIELNEQMELQCGAPPDGGAGECVCDAEALEDSGGARITPDGSELDMDDCDSLISERMLSVCSDPQRAPRGSSWALALYGDECFSPDVLEYAQKLSSHSESPTLEDKSQELHQQLIIESRNLKKTRTFYHKLIQQERKNKGSDMKVMVSKVKQQFDELRAKVEFLQSVKKYLQVLSVDQWGLALSLLPSLAACGAAPLELQHSEDPTLLHFLCEQRRGKGCPLVAATARGLIAYLYARNAHAEGFVQQFFYTYRYFCTPEELLQFLMDKFNSTLGANEDPSSDKAKVYQRTLDLLHFWIEDAQLVDFSSSSSLLQTLDAFLTVAPVDSRGAGLLATLQASPRMRRVCVPSCAFDASISSPEDEEKLSVNSCRRSSIEDAARKSFQWRVSRVVEPQTVQCKEKVFSIAAALPRPCYTLYEGRITVSCMFTSHSLLFMQEIFHDCHPVHFLNSRAHGVTENSGNISRCASPASSPLEGSGLLVSDVSGPRGPLQRLLTHADCVTNWVSAELVTCDSVKAQTALLARFLAVGKYCYETRNFATAMQILSGLENVIVRQLPAWKQLSLKVCEALEELRAVQVFLKSDNLCLMEGEKDRRRPTLPDALILALHIQQLEIGAFTMTSGAYKWPKLRNIARVVSQIHAFQERLYPYPPDPELQAYLRGRLARFGRCDIPLLASDNHINFSQMPAARRIHDTLRRVKASFQ